MIRVIVLRAARGRGVSRAIGVLRVIRVIRVVKVIRVIRCLQVVQLGHGFQGAPQARRLRAEGRLALPEAVQAQDAQPHGLRHGAVKGGGRRGRGSSNEPEVGTGDLENVACLCGRPV